MSNQPAAARAPNIRHRANPVCLVPAEPAALPAAGSEHEHEYRIGRGKPPREHRFKPGKSGNPKGRPNGVRGLDAMIRDVMGKKITIRTPTGSRKIPHVEALLMKLVELGVKGDTRAIERCLAHYASATPASGSGQLHQTEQPEQDLSSTDEAILQRYEARVLAAARASERSEGDE